MKKYTIGYIDHNQEVHSRQLGPSLKHLLGEFDVISLPSTVCPATNYNSMIEQCQTPYLILAHQDVTFSPDMLSAIDKTIDCVPEFGALGLKGMTRGALQNVESRFDKIQVLDSIDCCFFVIRPELGIWFDEYTFDDLHLYSEDYSCQVTKETGKLCYALLVNRFDAIRRDMQCERHPKVGYYDILNLHENRGYYDETDKSFIFHHSHTFHQLGAAWGKWRKYRKIFGAKWPGIPTT